jgi:hypothetical protein
VWLAGLGAGIYAIVAAAARLSCARSAHGLACRPAGSVSAGGLVLFVIAVVTTVTVATHESGGRRLAAWTLAGLCALGGCYLAAQALIGTA